MAPRDALRDRYGLPLRRERWISRLIVEALIAVGARVARYDSGEWDDPPDKLALLYDLERVRVLLLDGNEPFQPACDRGSFHEYTDTHDAPFDALTAAHSH